VNKEVTMSRKNTNTFLMLLLVLTVIFAFTSCGKLKVSNLRANYYFNRANALFSEGRYRPAIDEYERALIYNPDLVQAFRYLGECYKNLYTPGKETPDNIEKRDKALDSLNKAYEIDPGNKEIIYSLGDMYDRLKDFEEAEKMYLKIIEMEPTRMENYYVVAQFYTKYAGITEEEMGDGGKTPFQKAEEMYMRRIEVDPEDPKGYAYIAQFYDTLQPIPEFDKAHEIHMIRAKQDPDNAEIWYAIGVNRWAKAHRLQNMISTAEQKKLADESYEALQKAIEKDPSYPEPYAYMSVLNRSLKARLWPENAARLGQEADQYNQKFQDARKAQADRRRLEQELRGIR
jgi:tetratricopeptide (TPR) repeat protein